MKVGEKFTGIIEKNVWGGQGFLKNNEIAVFVKGGIEGQEVEYVITKNKKKFCEAEISEVLKKSEIEIPEEDRKNALPGCAYQNIKYPDQLRIKKNQLEEIFRKHESAEISEVLASPEISGYRNKIEFSCGFEEMKSEFIDEKKIFTDSGLALGFHPPKSWSEVFSVDDVFIASESANIIRREIENFLKVFISDEKNPENSGECNYLPWNPVINTGFWRGLIIRESRKNKEIIVNFVVSRDAREEKSGEFSGFFWDIFVEKFLEISGVLPDDFKISGILQTVHTGKSDAIVDPHVSVLWGEEIFEEQLGDKTFEISPFSFFQTNTKGAEILYSTVKKCIGDTEGKNVLDLFCGTGSIGIFCASSAKKVVGIEMVEEAVEKARKNAIQNGVKNAEFHAGKVEKILPEILAKDNFDTVIIDPPRAGMHPKALQMICNLPVKKLVYISCNPSTLERDAKLLKQARGWKLTKVQGVDMFPHTPHLEVVSVLER